MPIARLLRARGQDATHIRELGLSKVPDFRILTMAVDQGRVLLANDHDFIKLHGAWFAWSERWGVSAEHPGILLLDQHVRATRMLEGILAFAQTGLPLRNCIYEWTAAGAWRIPKKLEV